MGRHKKQNTANGIVVHLFPVSTSTYLHTLNVEVIVSAIVGDTAPKIDYIYVLFPCKVNDDMKVDEAQAEMVRKEKLYRACEP